MALWEDLASWRGPTANRVPNGMVEVRGLVVHIADGTYEGTISHQRDPDTENSSHFIVSREGDIAQLVDTADKAWTQRAGNGHWLSVECSGFSVGSPHHASHPGWERLTDKQIAALGRIFARVHEECGVPLALTADPSGTGLGHHSMGGKAWGHDKCPGPPIIAQKPDILAAARQIARPSGPTPSPGLVVRRAAP
ncbi:N-acetylmuramoyl-L-alanine amidase [Micromonospora sp. NPDC048868]|uniref:N-acetylmuramoyl-L-alanine amidase n=1 Tax=Micromonospora sp. NPDC048868 TaxID=3364258 RepID=UPI003716BFB6